MSINERLRYGRERANLTLKQVEERTGIGQSSLSEYEGGKRDPRLSQLQALADLYRRSVSFFLGEGDIPREVVLWRKEPPPDSAADIQAQFLRLCEQYHNLEVWCGERLPCLLPRAEGEPAGYGYSDAERLAYRVRSELQLGDRPGQSLLRVLEEACGIKVFHHSFEPTGSAACTVSETYGPAILLNTKHVRWRRNFDLAHELFHILTWHVFRTGDEKDALASEQEEKLATCFARHLLMPTEATRLAVNSAIKNDAITFDDLFDIARQFDVSVEALLWQMNFICRLDKKEVQSAISRYQATSGMWEDRERDDPPMRPVRFAVLAVKAFHSGEISQGRLAEYLGISRREAMHFFEQEALEDEEVTVPPA